MRCSFAILLMLFVCTAASAHDTWIQVDTPIVRVGDVAHINLCLGNHGNGHRDFKFASKISKDGWTLEAISPGGRRTDLKAVMTDTGSTAKEGFWTARYLPAEPGLHLISHALDKLHGTARAVKSSKAWVRVPGKSEAAALSPSATAPQGHLLEIIPQFDPVMDLCAGKPLSVSILHEGKPLPNARVTFIPRSQTLKPDFDPDHERTTDRQGQATWTPAEGDWVLIVVHHVREDQKGEGYTSTHYSATLSLPVPQIPRSSHGS